MSHRAANMRGCTRAFGPAMDTGNRYTLGLASAYVEPCDGYLAIARAAARAIEARRAGDAQRLARAQAGEACDETPTAGAATAAVTRVLLQRSPVAGFQYHDGEAVWDRLRVGDALALVREPSNPRDTRAVRIDWEGAKLGYMPARDNAAVSQLLDRGCEVMAKIVRLAMGSDPWQRVEVEFVLNVVPSR